MKIRVRKQSKGNRSKYILLSLLALLSLIAYTMQTRASKSFEDAPSNHKARPFIGIPSAQDTHMPFIQRWEKAFSQIEPVLRESPFTSANFFKPSEIVASNDTFNLPTEETGAGVPQDLEKYLVDLEDAIVAGLIPTANTGGFAGGVGGVGGANGGGNRRNANYVFVPKSDLDPANETGNSDNVSAVPVPAAFWLLGSVFIGLIGLRRKQDTL